MARARPRRYIKHFINLRLEDIKDELFSKCPRYMDLQNKLIPIQKMIIEKLPEENQMLVLEYEDLEASQASISERFIYKKGFMDGIRVSNLCRRITKL